MRICCKLQNENALCCILTHVQCILNIVIQLFVLTICTTHERQTKNLKKSDTPACNNDSGH